MNNTIKLEKELVINLFFSDTIKIKHPHKNADTDYSESAFLCFDLRV